MKAKSLLIGVIFSSICVIGASQNEDPAKLLAFTKKEQFDKYLKTFKWKSDKKNHSDSLDGNYFLYSKKTSGGGNAYIAIYPNKFVHYMVFYEAKKKYSKVLSYEEFLHMPEGKSRFNSSTENKTYAIKSINFEDPNENRNQNIFFGRTNIKEGMVLTPVENIEALDKQSKKKQKKKQKKKN